MPSEKSITPPIDDVAGAVGGPGAAAWAHLGGYMSIDGDLFRLSIVAIDRGNNRAAVNVLHRDDRSLNRVVEVGAGDTFDVGSHNVRVVDVGRDTVMVSWTAEPSYQGEAT